MQVKTVMVVEEAILKIAYKSMNIVKKAREFLSQEIILYRQSVMMSRDTGTTTLTR